jgi:hypothetical protein
VTDDPFHMRRMIEDDRRGVAVDRQRWHDEAIAIMDALHDGFLFDKSSDGRIEAIERADTRLRVILRLLLGNVA